MKGAKKLASIVLAVTASITSCISQPTPAKQAYDSIPWQVGSAIVQKQVEVQQPAYCIIHVRQIHETPEMSEKEGAEIEFVQDSVYHILKELIEKTNDHTVYMEGADEKRAQIIQLCIEKTKSLNERDKIRMAGLYESSIVHHSLLEYTAGTSLEHKLKKDLELIFKEVSMLQQQREYRSVFWTTFSAYNAAVRIAFEDSAVLQGAELEKANIAADEYIKTAKKSRRWSEHFLVIDNRENAFLHIMGNQKQPILITLYGKAHDFSDNFREWNRLNSSSKACLIQVTPEDYPKDAEEDNLKYSADVRHRHE